MNSQTARLQSNRLVDFLACAPSPTLGLFAQILSLYLQTMKVCEYMYLYGSTNACSYCVTV